ncbi:hypothetical protein NLU13_8495 [Sarocladium strictum]|uniref:RNA polymerase I, subunit RPA34.5 n=1 Tax=Sarocladium strictum TaxID=5046 RepID=A0AA39L516_SARSR|nr:hypothetical protein NLU13_8495 [Sarocladium strictum]
MAPKVTYKVHSLSKHVEDTQKGISAEAQYNRRAVGAAAIKKEASGIDPNIFANNDDDSSSDSDSDESSDGEDQSTFLSKLTATSSAPKKPATSLEKEVANSNDELKASDAKKVNPSKAPAAAAAAPSDESESESEEESGSGSDASSSSEDEAENGDANKSRATGAAVATATTTTSPTSSSGDDESSDEEEDNSKTNGVKLQKPTTSQDSSSEEESGSESESSGSDSEEDESQTAKKPAVNGKAHVATASTESNEASKQPAKTVVPSASTKATSAKTPTTVSDSDSDESESDPDSDGEDNAAVDESMHISDREEAGQLSGPKFIAPDFMIRRGDKDVNGKDVAEVCNQANLQGKQFWYFTVPSDIPISVIQNMEIPIDTAQRGDSVFSHNGDSYGVSFDSMTPKSTIQILIPSADGAKYQAAPRAVDQVVQVKRITNLGGSSTGTADPAYKRPVRPQPKGLKARYKPIGVSNALGNIGGDSDGSEADTEMADAPTLPTLPAPSPPAAEPAKEKKARKSKVSAGGDSAVESPKKGKKSKEKTADEGDSARKGKRKLTTSEEDAVAASSQLMGESQIAESKSKKQKTGRVASPDLSTKVTPVTAPTPGSSFSDVPDAAAVAKGTPNATAKKTPKKKTEKAAAASTAENGATTPSTKKAASKKSESKVDVPTVPSSQATASRYTPIAPPVIYGQPPPSSSAPAPTPTPAAKTTKKSASKKKDATQMRP